mmetsp:Transcript_66602/g.139040  ORF Transcript_66602/g.139040 Transcript_66602/m.139040 type:complete len:260 (+) Transcript_66602:58-837(+)
MAAESSSASQAPSRQSKPLHLLCFHGHGGTAERLCNQLSERFFSQVLQSSSSTSTSSSPGDVLEVTYRCMDGPMPEPSRRPEGRQWWRYDEGDQGDRPQDWAEMERAALKIAEECYNSETPYDGVLGFSQGAEMVHTLAVLKHRDDPRFSSRAAPKFGISLSGAVNPGHFESVGGGGPPRGLEGPRQGPDVKHRTSFPMLFIGDFFGDHWYSAERFKETMAMYADLARVEHRQAHIVPELSPSDASLVRRFLQRFSSGS